MLVDSHLENQPTYSLAPNTHKFPDGILGVGFPMALSPAGAFFDYQGLPVEIPAEICVANPAADFAVVLDDNKVVDGVVGQGFLLVGKSNLLETLFFNLVSGFLPVETKLTYCCCYSCSPCASGFEQPESVHCKIKSAVRLGPTYKMATSVFLHSPSFLGPPGDTAPMAGCRNARRTAKPEKDEKCRISGGVIHSDKTNRRTVYGLKARGARNDLMLDDPIVDDHFPQRLFLS